MELREYDIRDPAALVDEIAEWVTLQDGTVWLAQVDEPSRRQRVVRVDALETSSVLPRTVDGWWEASDELREHINGWDLPPGRVPTTAGVLVVVRHGLCVFGPGTAGWHQARRYVNHCRPVFSGDVILVTEHGWAEFMTQAGGHTPALVA